MPDSATANNGGAGRSRRARDSGAAPADGLAGELAAALRRAVEASFDELLESPGQLAALASRLGGAGARPGACASAEDFATVVEAVGLIERRIGALEHRFRLLAEVTDALAQALDGLRASGSSDGPAPGVEPAGPARP